MFAEYIAPSQIKLPDGLAEKIGLSIGDKLYLTLRNNTIILTPLNAKSQKIATGETTDEKEFNQ